MGSRQGETPSQRLKTQTSHNYVYIHKYLPTISKTQPWATNNFTFEKQQTHHFKLPQREARKVQQH